MLKKNFTNIFLPNGGEFNDDESHGIDSVKNHLKNKHKFTYIYHKNQPLIHR